MKNQNLFLTLSFMFLGLLGWGQSEDHDKLENLKYYNSAIKDNVQGMRYYTDSANVLSILDQMDGLTNQLDTEFEKVALPEIPEMDTDSDMIEDFEEEYNNDWSIDNQETDDDGGIGISKVIPFGNRINTKAKIDFGVNLLLNQNNESNILAPEVNTGRSWYWEWGVFNQAKLGSKTSKVAINYGLSYLINRFTFSNDIRLTTDASDNPLFISVDNLTKGPKLNVGYITLPVSLKWSLAKKYSLELGGYAGYRVHSVQKFQLRRDNEDIREFVYARHQLNNWMYGASLNLQVKSINLTAKYNVSNIFKDNDNYDFRILMLGTTFKLL